MLFSPDGRTLVSTSLDGTVIALGRRARRLARETLRGHSASVQQPVFSPDGKTLYTAGEAFDGTAIAWDVGGDRRLGRAVPDGIRPRTSESFPPPSGVSPDGRTLAVARLDGRVDLIDAETLRRTGGFEAFDGRPVLSIAFAPDGGTLAVAGVGGGVGIWDAASETRLGAIVRAPRGPVRPQGGLSSPQRR